jgi:small subunit ribosomal protein S1
VTLADQVEGTVDIAEVSEDKVDDASAIVKVGDEIEVKILNVDAKEKTIQLSFKSKNTAKPKAAKKKVEVEESSDNAGTTNLGALLKAKLDSKK